MSGRTDVCVRCGGEFHSQPYEAGKYVIYGGWCDNCRMPTLVIPSKAYDDDDYDVESESVIVASKIRKSLNVKHIVVDTPEFQFKWTCEPPKDGSPNCGACKHGYRKVVDGEDLGCACKLHPEARARFANVIEDCKEYEPRDVWYGMENHCRWCYWATRDADRNIYCHKQSKNIIEITEYDRGHCKDYEESSLWAFESIGMIECPKCGGMAKRSMYHKNKCHCGYRWDEE